MPLLVQNRLDYASCVDHLRKRKQAQTEETKMIQDIYKGLSKMEERVEALETILMDRQRKDY